MTTREIRANYDAIIVGAGPAGSTAAIRLATAGWSVALIEQTAFPRRKVCGECISATNLALLDSLGIGTQFATMAGAELRRVGLFVAEETLTADLPQFAGGMHRWGRALGREHLDTMLLQRAIEVGAHVWQPWRVKHVTRLRDHQKICHVHERASGFEAELSTPILIVASGSWEGDPLNNQRERLVSKASDLFAFKGTYRNARLAPNLLPVLAFPGGYGGMVIGDTDQLTLAFCIRRDVLRASRERNPGASAACAAQAHVASSCAGVRLALVDATLVAPWLTVGPIRPGKRWPSRGDGIFAIGNAAGEAHPILGEGMSMAIQSAWMLCDELIPHGEKVIARRDIEEVGRRYAKRWRRSFARRIRVAALFAHLAMRPRVMVELLRVIRHWPGLLTICARLGAKVRCVVARQR